MNGHDCGHEFCDIPVLVHQSACPVRFQDIQMAGCRQPEWNQVGRPWGEDVAGRWGCAKMEDDVDIIYNSITGCSPGDPKTDLEFRPLTLMPIQCAQYM